MEPTATAAIRVYFAKLGLENEVADIYLALHTYGPQTISELSRNAHIERTKIYRLIDNLMTSNLIEIESRYKRGVMKAAPIANLHILISQKEQELKSLQDELGLIEQVLARNTLSNPATRVQFYHGREGIRQMQWNQIKSKTEALSIIDEPLFDALGTTFTLRWIEAMNAHNIPIRLAISPHFDQVNREWYRREKISELVTDIEYRVVDPETFTISHNTDIWDNVTAYYNWHGNEIFGIEIYNQEIADEQRQFFKMLWAQSKAQVKEPTQPS